jgi:hypothetical protein
MKSNQGLEGRDFRLGSFFFKFIIIFLFFLSMAHVLVREHLEVLFFRLLVGIPIFMGMSLFFMETFPCAFPCIPNY